MGQPLGPWCLCLLLAPRLLSKAPHPLHFPYSPVSSCPSTRSGTVLSLRLWLLSTAPPPQLFLLPTPPTAQLPLSISSLPPRPATSPTLGPQTSWVLSPVSPDVAGAQPPGSGTSGCCLQMGRTCSELLFSPSPLSRDEGARGEARNRHKQTLEREVWGRGFSFRDDLVPGGGEEKTGSQGA